MTSEAIKYIFVAFELGRILEIGDLDNYRRRSLIQCPGRNKVRFLIKTRFTVREMNLGKTSMAKFH